MNLRNMLKPFYGVLKTMDRATRFALLTGVTKFGILSGGWWNKRGPNRNNNE